MGIPFDEKELEVVSVDPASRKTPVDYEHFKYPVTQREAVRATYEKKPIWLVSSKDTMMFNPRCIPENIARGMVVDAEPFNAVEEAGGPDIFGIEWVYEPEAHGSMVIPGTQVFDDANDWKDVLTFPDVDSWDWAGSAEINKEFLNNDKFVQPWLFTGWFERLISFMGFEDAAFALLDEDQEDAVAELMMALSDLYIDIVDHFVKYYDHIDGFYVHDDWGSQASALFNADVAERLIVPAMRKFTDHVHDLGLYCELHSCGNSGHVQTPNLIAAGWDSWTPQRMNDNADLWELYGDKIILPPSLDQVTADWSEEDQIAAAKAYVDRFCNTPGKVPYISMYDVSYQQPAYRKALYVEARKAFAKWPD